MTKCYRCEYELSGASYWGFCMRCCMLILEEWRIHKEEVSAIS